MVCWPSQQNILWHTLYCLFPHPLMSQGLFGVPKPLRWPLHPNNLALLECSSSSALALASSPCLPLAGDKGTSECLSPHLTSKEQGEIGVFSYLLWTWLAHFCCATHSKQPPKKVKLAPQGQPRFTSDTWWVFIGPILRSGPWAGQCHGGVKVWSQTLKPCTWT